MHALLTDDELFNYLIPYFCYCQSHHTSWHLLTLMIVNFLLGNFKGGLAQKMCVLNNVHMYFMCNIFKLKQPKSGAVVEQD